MNSEIMLAALDAFFAEDFEYAEKAGYDLSVATDQTGNEIFVDITSSDKLLPSIDVEPYKTSEEEWIFKVKVSFPTIDLEKTDETLRDIIESWDDAIALADDLESIKFDPNDWIAAK